MRMGGGPAAVRRRRREACPRCSPISSRRDVDFLGFHVFAGSQNLSAEILCRGAAQDGRADPARSPTRRADPCATSTSAAASASRTSTRTSRSTWPPIGDNLASCSTDRIRPDLPDARVVDRARPLHRRRVRRLRHPRRRPQGVPGPHYLVVDGGLHHQLAASGNFGQVIRRNYPIAVGNRLGSRTRRRRSTWSAACARRSTCWATMSSLPRAEIGDLIVLFQAGAYGLTASPTAFLGHPAPVEVLV